MLSGRFLAYSKRKKLAEMITRWYSFYHSLSLVIPLVVTRYSTCCHSLLLVVTRCSTRCHSSSLVVTRCGTRCHSLSLVSLFIDNRLKVFLRDVISVRRSRLQIFFRIGVLKKLATFTGKQLYWSLFLIKWIQHRCFSVNVSTF